MTDCEENKSKRRTTIIASMMVGGLLLVVVPALGIQQHLQAIENHKPASEPIAAEQSRIQQIGSIIRKVITREIQQHKRCPDMCDDVQEIQEGHPFKLIARKPLVPILQSLIAINEKAIVDHHRFRLKEECSRVGSPILWLGVNQLEHLLGVFEASDYMLRDRIHLRVRPVEWKQ